MVILFSYGTLRRPDVQIKTFGREVPGEPDLLPAHVLGAAGPHANAVFTGNDADVVHGIALQVTDVDLTACDEYERPFEYRRKTVTLRSGRTAWVYVFVPLNA